MKAIRVVLLFALTFALLTAAYGAASFASGAEPPSDGSGYIIMKIGSKTMNVNGAAVEVDPGRDTAPAVIDGRTMVPARALAEAMGGTVGWEEAARKITLSANGNDIVMTLGLKEYTINGAPAAMDVAPLERNGRTLIPLRFAGEALGCTVKWFGDTEEILVTFAGGSFGGANLPVLYSFTASVDEYLPDFKFIVSGEEDYGGDGGPYEYRLDVSCPGLPAYQPHSLVVTTDQEYTADGYDPYTRLPYIELVDIDFDGFADLQVFTSHGSTQVCYDYYRWDVFRGDGYGCYENEPFFSLMTADMELYPETKQIINTTHLGYHDNPRLMYQLCETGNGGWLGEYKLLRTESSEDLTDAAGYGSGDDDDVTTVFTVYGEKGKIFSKTMRYGDYAGGDRAELNNWLRFGAGKAVSAGEAANLLRAHYGECDDETGFPFSFYFLDMMPYEGLSCYRFSMSWLVDGDHHSHLTDCLVTPDGRVFEYYE